jgi:hypothetical protein
VFGRLAPGAGPVVCDRCATEIPRTVPCPRCQEPVPIAPAEALGCIDAACPERTWDALFCPACDQQISHLGADASTRNTADPVIHDRVGTFLLMQMKAMIGAMEQLIHGNADVEGELAVIRERLIISRDDLARAHEMMSDVVNTRLDLIPRYRQCMALREWEDAKAPPYIEPGVDLAPQAEPAAAAAAAAEVHQPTAEALGRELLAHLRGRRSTRRVSAHLVDARNAAELQAIGAP